jgi:ATP-dependent protease HslVU (ClpYQ) peptidase subunit
VTTIATDGISMAGDSLVTMGSDVVGYTPKVRKLKDGRIVGCAGELAQIQMFVRWLESPADDKPELEDFAALILNLDGTVDYMDKRLEPVRFIVPNAIGSGEGMAQGAMLAGKSPEEAVAIAAMRDTCTGGEITVLSLGDPPSLRAVA